MSSGVVLFVLLLFKVFKSFRQYQMEISVNMILCVDVCSFVIVIVRIVITVSVSSIFQSDFYLFVSLSPKRLRTRSSRQFLPSLPLPHLVRISLEPEPDTVLLIMMMHLPAVANFLYFDVLLSRK